jgi:hypothetical protein
LLGEEGVVAVGVDDGAGGSAVDELASGKVLPNGRVGGEDALGAGGGRHEDGRVQDAGVERGVVVKGVGGGFPVEVVQCGIWPVKIHVMCVVGVLVVHGGPMYQSTGVGAGLAVWIALFGKDEGRMCPAIVLNLNSAVVRTGQKTGSRGDARVDSERCASSGSVRVWVVVVAGEGGRGGLKHGRLRAGCAGSAKPACYRGPGSRFRGMHLGYETEQGAAIGRPNSVGY